MKRIGNLYPVVFDFENLYFAYLEARKNKRYRSEILEFSNRLEENLITIQNELIYKTYEVGRYREFYVYEPKQRLIMALPFKDRVVQWAIYRNLNPVFDKQFIGDSFACRKNKGTHEAIKRLKYWLRQVERRGSPYYYLKLDISKYFYRIDHEVLLSILRRKIKDEDLMQLLDKIINSEDTNFGLPAGVEVSECDERISETGVPIGNLTSQLFANLYLNELDQYCKQTLKIHYYIRYMDDVIILHEDKQYLHKIKVLIETFLLNELHLNLNNKTAIRPINTGIEFVGFRVWATHTKLKKKTAIKMKKRIKYLQGAYKRGEMTFEKANNSMQSYFGIMQHFNSFNMKSKILAETEFKKNNS